MLRPLSPLQRLLRALCWAAVISLPLITALYGLSVKHAYAEAARRGFSSPWCGNTITDPLALILSYSTPVAVLAVVAMGYLRQRRLVSTFSVVTAAILTVGCTVGLVTYGVAFFRGIGHPLSEFVWWLGPIEGESWYVNPPAGQAKLK